MNFILTDGDVGKLKSSDVVFFNADPRVESKLGDIYKDIFKSLCLDCENNYLDEIENKVNSFSDSLVEGRCFIHGISIIKTGIIVEVYFKANTSSYYGSAALDMIFDFDNHSLFDLIRG